MNSYETLVKHEQPRTAFTHEIVTEIYIHIYYTYLQHAVAITNKNMGIRELLIVTNEYKNIA